MNETMLAVPTGSHRFPPTRNHYPVAVPTVRWEPGTGWFQCPISGPGSQPPETEPLTAWREP
jgi:hypothetical protein